MCIVADYQCHSKLPIISPAKNEEKNATVLCSGVSIVGLRGGFQKVANLSGCLVKVGTSKGVTPRLKKSRPDGGGFRAIRKPPGYATVMDTSSDTEHLQSTVEGRRRQGRFGNN